jgi:glutathione S-transferase
MANLTLYTLTGPSRGAIARWMLEEVGEPYEVHALDRDTGEHRQPAYLKINPMGKVPAIRHGETLVSEAAAVCLYLAEAFPEAGLNIPVGNPKRGAFLKWLFFGPSCIEPAVLDVAFPRKEPAPRGAAGYGDFDTVMQVVGDALKPGPYLLGDRFTAADVIVGSQLRWGMMFGAIPKRDDFVSYTARLEARPALKRQMQLDGTMKKPA